MARGNSSSKRPDESIDKRLAPLCAATRAPASGRIRSLDEARRALGIPASAEPEVLQAWGTPSDFELVAFPVAYPEQPKLVAEFAVLRVIERQGRELREVAPARRLRMRTKSNLLWIVYGSFVQAADDRLVLESLSIGPAFEQQLSRKGDDIASGISAQLIRLLSPARLLSETVEQLQRQRYQLESLAERHAARPMPTSQRETFDKIEAGRPRHSHVSPAQTAAIAKHYITLCRWGNRHPLPQLAREFGITREQARDRVHKARKQGYLKGGKQGRAGAEPGPRLKGWSPPPVVPAASDSLAI